eukprot:5769424-Pleurochrysis_carterae.AAC.3
MQALTPAPKRNLTACGSSRLQPWPPVSCRHFQLGAASRGRRQRGRLARSDHWTRPESCIISLCSSLRLSWWLG